MILVMIDNYVFFENVAVRRRGRKLFYDVENR